MQSFTKMGIEWRWNTNYLEAKENQAFEKDPRKARVMNQSGLDELLEREFSVLTQKEHTYMDTEENIGEAQEEACLLGSSG